DGGAQSLSRPLLLRDRRLSGGGRAVMSRGAMIEVDISSERPEDAREIRALVAAAFGPDSDTADFVEAVRAVAEVCLAQVATRAGAIVGHAQWCLAHLFIDDRMVKG